MNASNMAAAFQTSDLNTLSHVNGGAGINESVDNGNRYGAAGLFLGGGIGAAVGGPPGAAVGAGIGGAVGWVGGFIGGLFS